jgi:hypothetical protein
LAITRLWGGFDVALGGLTIGMIYERHPPVSGLPGSIPLEVDELADGLAVLEGYGLAALQSCCFPLRMPPTVLDFASR